MPSASARTATSRERTWMTRFPTSTARSAVRSVVPRARKLITPMEINAARRDQRDLGNEQDDPKRERGAMDVHEQVRQWS